VERQSWPEPDALGLARTAIEYPPMQAPASFNLDTVKKQVQEAIKHKGE
jgi:hypothetical protein